jgi:hypothetical protein
LAGGPLAYETSQSLPDRGYESFLTLGGPAERLLNGQRGWTKDSDGVKVLAGPQLLDQKLSLSLFMILRLKDQYSRIRFQVGTESMTMMSMLSAPSGMMTNESVFTLRLRVDY